MKILISDIKEEAFREHFNLDKGETDGLLADPRGEVWAGQGGLDGELTISRVQETILIRGEVTVNLAFQCSRCTIENAMSLTVDVEAALFPRTAQQGEDEEDVELSAEDLDVAYYEGEEIDLDPILREAIYLEVPGYPRCPPEEEEACDARFESQQPKSNNADSETDDVDPRWNALRAMKARMAEEADKKNN